MALTKFTTSMDIISALADEPNDVGGLTAAQLKAKFDEGCKAIQSFVNNTLTTEIDANFATKTEVQGVVLGQIPDGTITAPKLSSSFTLPIEKGGTGATTPEAARSNLGIVQTITGATAPTTATVGVVGQFYLYKSADGTKRKLYQCVDITNGVYTWDVVLPDDVPRLGSTTYAISILGQSYWETAITPGNSINRVAADGAGHVVGVGSAGALAYSSDNGNTWTSGTLISASYYWVRVRWIDNKFIAVGYSNATLSSAYGVVVYSNDFGVTWNIAYQCTTQGSSFRDVCYSTSNSMYFVIGYNSNNNTTYAYSTNLTSGWSYVVGPGNYGTTCMAANGYIAYGCDGGAGMFQGSAATLSFAVTGFSNSYYDSVFANNVWVMISTGGVSYCSTAQPNAWNQNTNVTGMGVTYDSVHGIFNVPGAGYSTNGTTWTVAGGFAKNYNTCYSQNRFVAVSGNSAVCFSENKNGTFYKLQDANKNDLPVGTNISSGTYIGTGSDITLSAPFPVKIAFISINGTYTDYNSIARPFYLTAIITVKGNSIVHNGYYFDGNTTGLSDNSIINADGTVKIGSSYFARNNYRYRYTFLG